MRLTNQQLFALLVRRFRDLPLEHGFKHNGHGAFSRIVNDVVWYIAMYSIPMKQFDGLSVQYEFDVLSPVLLKKTGIDIAEPDWGSAQIRATFAELSEQTWDVEASVLTIASEQDAEDTAVFAKKVALDLGMPFLASIRSTDDVIRLYEENHFSATGRPAIRARYEIAVWRGDLDPAVHPFHEWSKYEPDGGISRRMMKVVATFASDSDMLAYEEAMHDLGFVSTHEHRAGKWFCEPSKETKAYDLKPKEMNTYKELVQRLGGEFLYASVGTETVPVVRPAE